jgi:PAS domain S-box-containing protein
MQGSIARSQLSLFVRHAPVAVAMFDRDMRYLAVSRRWMDDYRLSGDVVGQSHYELFTDLPDRYLEAHRRALAGETTGELADQFDRADGSTHWVSWQCRPWHESDGTVGGIILFVEDVTERKRAEEELRVSEAFNRSLMEGSADCVKVIDLDGRLMMMNGPGLCQMEIDDFSPMCGQPWAGLWPEAAREQIAAAVTAARAGTATRFEAFCATAKGNPKYWEVTVSPVRDGSGEIVRLLSISRDVTKRRQSEEALRESERRLRLALEASDTGFWEFDFTADRAEFSPECCRILGLEPTHLTLSVADCGRFVHPDDNVGLWERFNTAVAERTTFEHEYRVVRPGGGVRWVRDAGRATYDAFGKPLRFSGTLTDITSGKVAEEALRESERRLRLALEASDTGLWTWDLRTDAVSWSPECHRIHGMTEGDFEGTGAAFFKLVHADDRDRVIAAVSGAAARHELYECEFRIVRPDGQVLWVANRGRASYDDDSRPVSVLGTITDITRRKQAEEALRGAERRFQMMADGIPFPVWVHDTSGALVMVNRTYCEYFDVTEQQVLGEGWHPLLHPDDAPEYVDTFLQSLRDRQPWRRRCRVRRPGDEKWRWVESSSRPHFSETGDFLGIVGCSPDVTAHVSAETALREADRNKDQFLATLAHELRNPLAAIRGAVEVVRRTADRPGSNVAPLADVLDRQSKHLTLLVDDLMDVSRVSTGKIQLRRTRVELDKVLTHAAETVQPACEAKQVALRVTSTSAPTLLCVDGDADRLAQVVGNLLNNACKFTDPGGQVDVSATREGDEAVIRVRDTGIGISPDQIGRIFDLFAQIESPDGRQRAGLGIGLSLVKSLVEMHGGHIDVRSDGPGKGTEFTLRLPAVPDVVEIDPSAGSQSDGGARNGRRILVADDNRDAAEMLAALLTLSGHDVHTASSGEEAIEKAERLRPDLALLDVGMPGVDGHEAARRIRARLGQACPVLVALTGWGEVEDRERSRKAGFDAHLVKPTDLSAIENIIAGKEIANGQPTTDRSH